MLRNDACPDIRVDPQTFDVFVDGVLATCEPAERAAARPALHAAMTADRLTRLRIDAGQPRPGSAARIGIGGPVGSGKTALIERLIPRVPAPRHRPRRGHQRPRHQGGRRAAAPLRPDRSGAGRRRSRRAPARTRSSARTRRSTSPPPTTRSALSRSRADHDRIAAATISPRPSRSTSSTGGSSSSTSPAATTFRASADPACCSAICWSSTRPTLRPMSASISSAMLAEASTVRGGRPTIACRCRGDAENAGVRAVAATISGDVLFRKVEALP